MKKMKDERIEFLSVRSDYNVYEIENGQTLKIKLETVDIINTSENEQTPTAKIQTKLISHVISPKDIDTSGLERSTGIVTEKDHVKELNFKTIKEVVNIYETKKAFIFTALNLEEVFLTNKKNAQDEPILRFTSNNGIDFIQKPEFKTKASQTS